MNKTSKVIVVFVLILVVLFGVGQFFAFSNLNTNQAPSQSQSASQNQTAPTEVIAFAATLPATGTVPTEKGSCFGGSIAAAYRRDAWRCTVGNAISDPCFEITGNKNLLCGVNPAEGSFATTTFVLQLTKPLPSEVRPTVIPKSWAWAVQLADGTYCTPFTGSRPFTASGTMAVYACNSQNPQESMIFGELDASSDVWMAEVGNLNTSSSSLPTLGYSIKMPVAKVWQ
ncbi:MAG TPA: hypothetical protein VMU07_00140 [Candidatus Paceibacterota bacterium]|nr:hypothetical protein [Candidatus Paceibacterota bacterium]